MKSSEETLLREAIRSILLEDTGTMTVGHLRNALRVAKGIGSEEKMKAAGKEAAKRGLTKGAGALIGLIPGGGTIWSAIEAGIDVKGVYKAATKLTPEEKKANPLWDFITIDPDTSAIVDDGVESNFIIALGDSVDGLPDNAEIPDADVQLTNYLKDKFSGAHITK